MNRSLKKCALKTALLKWLPLKVRSQNSSLKKSILEIVL